MSFSNGGSEALRPVNGAKFRSNYDRIFGKDEKDEDKPQPRVGKVDPETGLEYLGCGCWKSCDCRERELRPNG